MDLIERYVRLCLRVDRHVDGFVDAYVGPSAWRRAIELEAPVEPPRLRDEARRLLDGLAETDLEASRRRWLRAQLEALICVLDTRLLGAEIAWADEVERCLGVRPRRTAESVIDGVHRELDAALAGPGSVRERYNAWDRRNAVPRATIVPALERLRDVLGPRTRALAPMPDDESVTYELVSGVPWIAYNRYQGEHRSLVEVNADLPVSVVLLVDLCAHEAYPGHHAERAIKEVGLYRGLGRVETSVVITPAPESVVSEGLACNALETALGPEPFHALEEVLARVGVRFDPAEADAVHRAGLALRDTGTNAAFMLHEADSSVSEVTAYLRERGLESDEGAARSVRFLTDPDSRAYVSAYPDGARLCRAFVARSPDGFARLLTEQLTPADLIA